METIMQYIPLAVSAILLAALILTVITNIITQVVKKITWDKIPTNILAVVVAMGVTLVAFFAACKETRSKENPRHLRGAGGSFIRRGGIWWRRPAAWPSQ